MIEGLARRGGAEEVSPPTRDALARKRTSAATSTDLPNLFTFYLCLPPPCMSGRFRHWQLFFCAISAVLLRCPFLSLPFTAIYLPLPYTSHCRIPPTAVYLPLPYTSHCRIPPTAVYLLLPCMPPTAMHASHCHACQDSPDTGNFSFVQSYSSIFRKELIDALISNLHLH
jgi:hypothetical protein